MIKVDTVSASKTETGHWFQDFATGTSVPPCAGEHKIWLLDLVWTYNVTTQVKLKGAVMLSNPSAWGIFGGRWPSLTVLTDCQMLWQMPNTIIVPLVMPPHMPSGAHPWCANFFHIALFKCPSLVFMRTDLHLNWTIPSGCFNSFLSVSILTTSVR